MFKRNNNVNNQRYYELSVKSSISDKSLALSITGVQVQEREEEIDFHISTTNISGLIGRDAKTVKEIAKNLSEYWGKKASIQLLNSSLFYESL